MNTDAALIAEVRAWLRLHWEPSLTVREWWRLTTAAGWQFPSWPVGLGGADLTTDEARLVHTEFAAFGALGPPFGVAQTHGAPVIAAFGDAEQCVRLLPPVARGEESWCQFFSEPGAGSDLAAVRTSAVLDGERWIVNGQKVWTSGATTAARGILLARTDTSAAKHRGLSLFVIDLDQPGVEIRSIKQMNGSAEYFNESFFTDAVVSHRNLIGGEGNGWRLAVATLAFERAMNAKIPGLVTAPPGPLGGMLDRRAGDVLAAGEQTVPYFSNRAYVQTTRLIQVARERHATAIPDVRQTLARLYALDHAIEWTDARAKAGALQGNEPGVEANLVKLAKSRLSRGAQHLGGRLLGAHAMLVGPDSFHCGAVAEMILTVPSFSIAGGTDEIQHNVIAERGLGLPREPASEGTR
ncbi:MAG: acyl-CoA dehydrogenase family protein [Acidimicrobiales bacterium]|nr:acyl-CoA dehydrogenase family protein [Acidimicrobiales bacterium]